MPRVLSALLIFARVASGLRVPKSAAQAYAAALARAGPAGRRGEGAWASAGRAALGLDAGAGAGARALSAPFPVTSGNFFCERFLPTCAVAMGGAGAGAGLLGCTAPSAVGCGGPGNGTLDLFVGGNSSCTCAAPFVLTDVSSTRVAELLWDAAVGGPAGVTLFLAPGSATYGNQTDMPATFGYLCFTTLFTMGCPISKVAIVAPGTGGANQNATCRCGAIGNFDFAPRALETITDAITVNATNFILTQVVDLGNSYPPQGATSNDDFTHLFICNPNSFLLLCQTYLTAINCTSSVARVGDGSACTEAFASSYSVRGGLLCIVARGRA